MVPGPDPAVVRGAIPSMVFFTVGHSNRTREEFLGILREHGVDRLVDVRSHPRSRRQPHFNAEAMPGYLSPLGIDYRPMPSLGGFRKPRRDSPNLGLRSAGFRGYADFMAGPEFGRELDRLVELGRGRKAAILCAEAVYWACHRFLIADSLVHRGHKVRHLLGPGKAEDHRLTPFAVVEAGRLVYPPVQKELF